MRIRADFAAPAAIAADEHRWVASPESGVERVMLDRVGDEVAVATSIVRYAPGSRFAAHRHDRGEEFLVLDGVFADEHGRYPAGTYVRNPPGSAHSPRSDEGCLLFVKLRQFAADDGAYVAIDTAHFGPALANDAIRVRGLHRHGKEQVLLVDGAVNRVLTFDAVDVPRECFVVTGVVDVGDWRLTRLGWLRLPAGSPLQLRFETAGQVLVKTRPVLE
ncbi:MAG TPA: cupin domain-containing protein [Pseudomonadales bacterium]|nr:cupin domain-containing protein [Pseudomonadales bacterium]